jgi:hypothetical protein
MWHEFYIRPFHFFQGGNPVLDLPKSLSAH